MRQTPMYQTTIDTSGEAVHRLSTLLGCITDEYRLTFDEHALTTCAVDPANVAMVDLEVGEDSEIDIYAETDGTGFDLESFETGINYARKGRGDDTGDPVSINHNSSGRVEVRVNRPDGAERRYSWYPPDPGSIRSQPELPDITYAWDVRLNVEEFADTIKCAKGVSDAVQMGVEPVEGLADGMGDFYVFNTDDGDDNRTDSEFRFEGGAEWIDGDGPEPQAAIYSLDYLKYITKALNDAGIEKCNFRFRTEFPCEIHFEDPKYGYSGRYVLAPRQSEDGSAYRQPVWDKDAYTMPTKDEVQVT